MLEWILNTISTMIINLDGTLTGTTTPGQIVAGSNGNKRVLLTFPELEPQHQIQFSIILRTPLFCEG